MSVPEAFVNNLRNKQAFVNIRHDKSSFFYYKNKSLTKREVIDFGHKNLTHEIESITNVNEQDAIKILKIYKMFLFMIRSLSHSKYLFLKKLEIIVLLNMVI